MLPYVLLAPDLIASRSRAAAPRITVIETAAFAFAMLLLTSTPLTSQAQLLWTVGLDDNAWPLNLTGGGPNTAFVQEGGGTSLLTGNPSNVPTVPALPICRLPAEMVVIPL